MARASAAPRPTRRATTGTRRPGVPSIAVSLVGKAFAHYETAGRVARELVERIRREPFAEPVLLNVNVPDLPYAELAGLEVTRRAFESLLRDPARIVALDFADVVKALEQLGKLEQLVGGHATERVETSAPATSKEDRLSDLWSSAAGRALLAEARATRTIGGRKGSA